MRRSCVDLPERRPSQKSYFSLGKENYLDIESWKKKSSHQSNPLSILPSPKSSNQYRSKHSSILTLIHFLAITSSSQDILERRRPPLSRERPRLVQACYQRLWRLEHPQPRASSPSYNLLVNFASLLEGYVRWDKKYLERERERETRLFQLRKGLPGPLLPLRSCYRHSLSLCATSIADSTYLEPSSSISSNGTERERDPLGCVGG